jgi:hypothetical protein
MAQQIVITYPPNNDGELHIVVEATHNPALNPALSSFQYTFTHASRGDAWATLVAAAQGIIAQDRRRRG